MPRNHNYKYSLFCSKKLRNSGRIEKICLLFARELIIMGTCETGVLRCFDARHEASMWSEWLYTYMYSVYQRTCFGVCTRIRASVWWMAGLSERKCRRRHAANPPEGPMRKEIPAPGLPELGDAAELARRGCGAPGCGAGFGRVQFSSINLAIHNVLYQLAA